MSFRTDYQNMAVKVQAAPTVPETLAAADGAEDFFTSSIDETINMTEREGQGTFSPITQIAGTAFCDVAFSTWFKNSGSSTAPIWISRCLLAAGWAQVGTTSVYTPSIAAATALTAGHFIEGEVALASDVMLDFEIKIEKVGPPPQIDWKGKGLYVAATAQTLITPTYPTAKPFGAKGMTLSLGSISPFVVSKMGFKMGNDIYLREDLSAGQGYSPPIIQGRKPRLSLTVEMPPSASYQYWTQMLANTEAAFSAAIGAGSNNVLTLACPKLQVIGIKRVKLGKVAGLELECQPNRNTSIGDNEISLTLS